MGEFKYESQINIKVLYERLFSFVEDGFDEVMRYCFW